MAGRTGAGWRRTTVGICPSQATAPSGAFASSAFASAPRTRASFQGAFATSTLSSATSRVAPHSRLHSGHPRRNRQFVVRVVPQCRGSESIRSHRGFRDADAGTQHVNSAHIKEATKQVPSMLAHTPKVLYTELPGTEWSLLVGDVGVRQRTDLIERWRPNRRITVRSKRVHAPIDTISGREQLERPISVASQSFLLISIG
jgi:hypothetical protein